MLNACVISITARIQLLDTQVWPLVEILLLGRRLEAD